MPTITDKFAELGIHFVRKPQNRSSRERRRFQKDVTRLMTRLNIPVRGSKGDAQGTARQR
jgi:hypothetical protein